MKMTFLEATAAQCYLLANRVGDVHEELEQLLRRNILSIPEKDDCVTEKLSECIEHLRSIALYTARNAPEIADRLQESRRP